MKNNPFLVQNLFYNSELDFYICPMGQRMENIGKGQRISSNGYESQITHYQAKRCDDCPLRSLCHQAKGNRRIEVNHRLNHLKHKKHNSTYHKKTSFILIYLCLFLNESLKKDLKNYKIVSKIVLKCSRAYQLS